jgi:hypothetical protein
MPTLILPCVVDPSTEMNWTNVGGANATASVALPDDDLASYVLSAPVGDLIIYNVTNSGLSFVVINSVTVFARTKISGDPVNLSVSDDNFLNQAYATYPSGINFVTENNYSSTTKPSGGAWTVDSLDSLQIQIQANDPGQIWLTTLYVSVDYTDLPSANPILTNMLEPICEIYYKYQKALSVQSANINTVRNYGFSTSFALNSGFELFEPFDLNNIKLQPGVFTYNNSYYTAPNLAIETTIDVQNIIKLQDLPTSGVGTVNYVDQTLPIKISIKQNSNSIIGIASAYETDGIPYGNTFDLNEPIIRNFESSLVTDPELAILILLNLEDATFTGNQYNWSVAPSALYRANIQSYRFDNGFGQFYSFNANNSFIRPTQYLSTAISTSLYNSTYMNVYNWANTLSWEPDFETWYNNYSDTLPYFLHKFLVDYFGLS